jgi:F0F1-type ATP synthase assembly protein I
MKITYQILLGLHVLTVLALIALLILQGRKTVKRIPTGFTHLGLTAMVLGIAMIALNAIRHNHDKAIALLNHSKFGLKFVILTVILAIAYRYAEKPSITNRMWTLLLGLSLTNLVIASAWM